MTNEIGMSNDFFLTFVSDYIDFGHFIAGYLHFNYFTSKKLRRNTSFKWRGKLKVVSTVDQTRISDKYREFLKESPGFYDKMELDLLKMKLTA